MNCAAYESETSTVRCPNAATHRMMAVENRHEILAYVCWPHKEQFVREKIECRFEPMKHGEEQSK